MRQSIAAPELVDIVDGRLYDAEVGWIVDDGLQIVQHVRLEDVGQVVNGAVESRGRAALNGEVERHKLARLIRRVIEGRLSRAHHARAISEGAGGDLVQEVVDGIDVLDPLVDGRF